MHKYLLSKKFLKIFVFLAVVGVSCFGFIKSSAVSSTTLPATHYGYFTGKYSTYQSAHVLADSVVDGSTDSVPICISNKQELVNYIKALHYKSGTFVCNGVNKAITTTYSSRDKIGADFIIQTMRSDGSSYDRTTPTDAEVDAWATKVLSYPGTISWWMSKADAGITDNTVNTVWSSNINDITMYKDSGSASPNGNIVFSYNGVKEYIIKRNCGNPMGFLSGITAAWYVEPIVSIDKATAYAGSTVTWTHKVSLTGGPATRTINYYYKNVSGFSSNILSAIQGSILAGQGPGSRTYYSSITIPSTAAVGHRYCRSTASGETSIINSSGIYSNEACVTVIASPTSYELKPLIVVNPDDTTEVDTSLDVTPSVNNIDPNATDSSGGVESGPTKWALTQTIVNPGVSVPNPTGGTSSSNLDSAPCTFFSASGAVCTVKNSGSGVIYDTGSQISPPGKVSYAVGSFPIGTKICYAFSVSPRMRVNSTVTEGWAHSAPVCVTIAKKPKVNVWGGDVKVGRSFFGKDFNTDAEIRTSTTTKSTTTFGSWAEYALVAPGIITGAGSGSALNGGLNNVANVCQYSALSFSNADTNKSCSSSITAKNDSIGNYSFNKTSIPDISSKFPLIKGTTPVLPASGNLDSKNGLYTVDDTNAVTITGSTISKGKWVVVNAPNATVTITGDIKLYAGADIEQISEIPQVIIIAKNIRIASGVKQIDSWLIAKSDSNDVGGAINTCVMANGAPVTPDICKEKLIINGPVMSKTLRLERTAGSDSATGSGSPAEVINLRADAYLWAYYHAAGSGRVWTAYSTNVPPRL